MYVGTKRPFGFTLVELMVAVAIVGILASIAFPSYLQQMEKGHRSGAEGYLMDLAQRQQQYLTDTRGYAPDVGTLNDPVPNEVVNYYTVQICSGSVTASTCPYAATTPPTFVVIATAIGDQVSDGNLSIDSTGAKTPANLW
jgi:type IV pilus assembly protein PilE